MRAARCTWHPSRARLSAAAYPMPFDAPVMSAVRPAIPRSIRLLLKLRYRVVIRSPTMVVAMHDAAAAGSGAESR